MVVKVDVHEPRNSITPSTPLISELKTKSDRGDSLNFDAIEVLSSEVVTLEPERTLSDSPKSLEIAKPKPKKKWSLQIKLSSSFDESDDFPGELIENSLISH